MAKSKKKIGLYEREIMSQMKQFFDKRGYTIFEHVRFNIAWSGPLSDVDLLLIKDGEITLVEIKSYKDKLSRANKQINKIYDFVDYVFLVTENNINQKEIDENIGKIIIKENNVEILSLPKKISKKPTKKSYFQLNKKCLCEFFPSYENIKYEYKYKIVDKIFDEFNYLNLKEIIQKIAVCGGCEKEYCPIHKYMPHKNINF